MVRKWFLAMILLTPIPYYYFHPREDYTKAEDTSSARDEPLVVLSHEEKTARYLLASMSVAPGQSFPALLCWEPLRVIGQRKVSSLDDLLPDCPLEFLEGCLKRYQQQVRGYRLIFHKQERIAGKLQNPELVQVQFREKPFSVHMTWLKGERVGLAWQSLYVEGENKGNLLALGVAPFLGKLTFPIAERKVDSDDAKKSSRYPINEFGIGIAMRGVLASMHKAQRRNALHLKYEGLVNTKDGVKEKEKELGGRPCHKFVRTPYEPPEEKEGVNELTIYIDKETHLQVGNILRDAKNELIAEYFFRNIKINPEFDADEFTRKSLR